MDGSVNSWATDAAHHLESYIRHIVNGKSKGPAPPESPFFFNSAEADDEAYSTFRSFLPAFDINSLPPPSDIMSVFDSDRTWKPLLSRLPGRLEGGAKLKVNFASQG